MFARNVSIHLKSNMLSEYGHVFESQILPLLRKQKGFRTNSRSLVPTEWTSRQSVCGTTKRMQKPITPLLIPKW